MSRYDPMNMPAHKDPVGCRNRVSAALSFGLFFCLSGLAGISREDFSSARSGRLSPAVEIRYDCLFTNSKTSSVNELVADLRGHGFGTVVLQEIVPGSNSWKSVAELARICGDNGMRLDCEFFVQDTQAPVLAEIRSAALTVDFGSNVSQAVADENQRWVARMWNPPGDSNAVVWTKAVIEGRHPRPQEGRWTEYRFSAEPLKPATLDYLDHRTFAVSLNGFLINAQRHLGHSYGTVVHCLRFPAAAKAESVWSDSLPRWFRENFSFDYIKALPLLTGVVQDDSPAAQAIRQRFRRGLEKLWRDGFCADVQPLVSEAGLDAAVVAERVPLPPEEIALYFHVPVLNAAANADQRRFNRRVSEGARQQERARIIGRVNPADADLGKRIGELLADGATQISFADGEIFISGAGGQDSLKKMVEFAARCSVILGNSEPVPVSSQTEFLFSSNDGPTDLEFLRRNDGRNEYFLVRNESESEGMVELRFRAGDYSRLSRWQPTDGKIIEIVNWRRIDPQTTALDTPVRPHELFFIVFEKEEK